MTYDIFISYNSKRKEWVSNLVKKLQRRKYEGNYFKVFFDEFSIKTGESIPTAIRNGLKKSRFIIFIMTPEWVNSEWCIFEADTAIFFDPAARNRKIIPLLLEDCEIPPDLARLKYIDFRDPMKFASQLKKLINELKESPGEIALHRFLENQKRQVLNLPSLPWIREGGPSLDFLWPDLFIEPRINLLKHPSSPQPLMHWVSSYNWQTNIAIIGPPGIGKSTILRVMVLRMLDQGLLGSSRLIPILTTAGEIFEVVQSSGQEHIDKFLAYKGLKIGNVQVEKIKLFVDGLDELSDENIPIVMKFLLYWVENIGTVWLGCRKEFFLELLRKYSTWNSLFTEFLEIVNWDQDKDTRIFVSKYAQKTGQLELDDRYLNIRLAFPEIDTYLKNPFEVTLLLYLLSGTNSLARANFINSYTLYLAFYSNWMAREHHRGTATLAPEYVMKLHQDLALNLYADKGANYDLLNIVKGNKDQLVALLADTSFTALLIFKSEFGITTNKIVRFWHETIGEFLVAEKILSTFKDGGRNLFETLNIIYNYEINLFVRGAVQLMDSREIDIIVNNLESLYVDLLLPDHPHKNEVLLGIKGQLPIPQLEKEDFSKNELDTRIREQIIYYLGRIPASYFPEIFRFAYQNEPSSLLRRIAALGAILYGDEKIEIDYLSILIPNSEADIENRSVQLVYFGDVDGEIGIYKDTQERDWIRTRNAIFDRLKQSSIRELRLRWWDLRTLSLFYMSRGWRDKPSLEQLDILKQTKLDSSDNTPERTDFLNKERQRLLQKLLKVYEGK